MGLRKITGASALAVLAIAISGCSENYPANGKFDGDRKIVDFASANGKVYAIEPQAFNAWKANLTDLDNKETKLEGFLELRTKLADSPSVVAMASRSNLIAQKDFDVDTWREKERKDFEQEQQAKIDGLPKLISQRNALIKRQADAKEANKGLEEAKAQLQAQIDDIDARKAQLKARTKALLTKKQAEGAALNKKWQRSLERDGLVSLKWHRKDKANCASQYLTRKGNPQKSYLANVWAEDIRAYNRLICPAFKFPMQRNAAVAMVKSLNDDERQLLMDLATIELEATKGRSGLRNKLRRYKDTFADLYQGSRAFSRNDQAQLLRLTDQIVIIEALKISPKKLSDQTLDRQLLTRLKKDLKPELLVEYLESQLAQSLKPVSGIQPDGSFTLDASQPYHMIVFEPRMLGRKLPAEYLPIRGKHFVDKSLVSVGQKEILTLPKLAELTFE